MYCKACGKEIHDQAVICVHCGVPTTLGTMPVSAPKTRTAYILLGVLAGIIAPGVHNLYVGYTGRGLTQLLLTVLTCWILWIPMYI